MITFKSIASGSSGNAYLVEADDGTAPLLLEAGLPIRQLREKLNFGLSGLAGCLVSHEHGDHSKAVKDLLKAGVDCNMSLGTATALSLINSHRFYRVQSGVPFSIYTWSILPFTLKHDAAEPLGFVITHGTDRLLFMPDTKSVDLFFDGLTLAAVECNHIGDILEENIKSGRVDEAVGKRVPDTHMSLDTLIAMLKANDLSKCRKIYLLHLSDANSDEERMRREVQEATGIPVEVC